MHTHTYTHFFFYGGRHSAALAASTVLGARDAAVSKNSFFMVHESGGRWKRTSKLHCNIIHSSTRGLPQELRKAWLQGPGSACAHQRWVAADGHVTLLCSQITSFRLLSLLSMQMMIPVYHRQLLASQLLGEI